MNRRLFRAWTQGVGHVDLPFNILPNGVGVPTLGEGDPNGTYYTVTRTGVGTFNIVTKDKYLALVNFDLTFMLNAQVTGWSFVTGAPTSAGGILTIPFTIYLAGTATDIAANANNRLMVWARFRNSTVTP